MAPSCATLAINSQEGFDFRPWARCPGQGRAGLAVGDHSGVVDRDPFGSWPTPQRGWLVLGGLRISRAKAVPAAAQGALSGGRGEKREETSCTRLIWGWNWREMTINNSAPEITFLALINQEPLQPALPSLRSSRFRGAVGAPASSVLLGICFVTLSGPAGGHSGPLIGKLSHSPSAQSAGP